ncbi:PREDICTED: metalloendoproteinase 1-like [Nelumbo nucifera]|uniref:Metalloendoproteinase 1-like n=2 Tax=Nelumbo nucifera TaxID=4432 RepID=A0A1U8AD82_NELNU|nr:PREDICTED: metalloendoproteinase 1-like [Nelumbo nucifera]DAD34708.1 TPA_asm: hypothetical protein HUJ06_005348 [Nelumbo nucifera]
MAATQSSLLAFFVLLVFSLLSQSHGHGEADRPEAFQFLRQSEGCHKGDRVKGLNQVKRYLQRFGYLDHHNDDDDDFDHHLESAIKTYQLNYNLKETGSLDVATVKQMMLPRCGVPDIIKGETWMRSGKEKKEKRLLGVSGRKTTLGFSSHYTFFNNTPTPKWPPYKMHLKYVLDSTVPVDDLLMHPLCYVAFARWAAVSNFTFEETQDLSSADIRFSFFKGDHGDGNPFDGPGGVLAHAYAPIDGRVHFDSEERWTTGIRADWIDTASVAMHEIGHLLGLGHSSEHGAVMFPYIDVGSQKVNLHPDDIQGIQSLYGIH